MPRSEHEKFDYYLGKGAVQYNNGIERLRQNTYEEDFFLCQLPSDVDAGTSGYDDDANDTSCKPVLPSKRQQLLRTIGTEVLINRGLKGTVAVVQSDLQWFATSTSHAAVDTVLDFFGVPSLWRRFFRRYLEAPLRMVDLEGESANVRIRKVRMHPLDPG